MIWETSKEKSRGWAESNPEPPCEAKLWWAVSEIIRVSSSEFLLYIRRRRHPVSTRWKINWSSHESSALSRLSFNGEELNLRVHLSPTGGHSRDESQLSSGWDQLSNQAGGSCLDHSCSTITLLTTHRTHRLILRSTVTPVSGLWSLLDTCQMSKASAGESGRRRNIKMMV